MKHQLAPADRSFCVALVLAAVFAAMTFSARAAVVLTNLYSFGVYTNGAFPACTLVLGNDGDFYGTTEGGGTNCGVGTVFKVSAGGSLVLLHTFTGGNDGAQPWAGLTQGADGDFYGVAAGGGTNGYGTVFKITSAGVFTALYSFTGGADGGNPQGALVQGTNGLFYGTTIVGGTGFGTAGYGTLFSISASGGFNPLYSFTDGDDGAKPFCGLLQGADGFFYGTTFGGGANGDGTTFKISAAGTFYHLYSFVARDTGFWPYGTMVQATNGLFYGTTYEGGYYNRGTVFQMNSAGVVEVVYPFTTNDGAACYSGLVQGNDGSLYGTTFNGGSNQIGMVFNVSLKGAFSDLYSFSGGSDGSNPYGGLALGNDGNFYGTTFYGGRDALGGENGLGGVFKITAAGLFTPVYSFPSIEQGWNPATGLAQGSDGNFYGVTAKGGTNNWGVVIKISPGGSLTNLYLFTDGNDGGFPNGLVQGNDGNFYGTTFEGGSNNVGVVFRISTNGAFSAIYAFTGGNDGSGPVAGLVQGTDGWFYGVTSLGGNTSVLSAGAGAIFKISTNSALIPLYQFTGGNDGATPDGALAQGADGYFYGTTSAGGSNSVGTIFKISPTGSFDSLYSFTGGSDGANPYAGLFAGSDGSFYGTAAYGGYGVGTVFKISPRGVFTNLYSFTGGDDGGIPDAPLTEGNDGNYYGTTFYGGANTNGTVFRVSPNGGFSTIYSFTGGTDDGGSSEAGLVQGFDGNFYSTTYSGGAGNRGVVFRLSVGLGSNPVILTTDGKFGVLTNAFGFDVLAVNGSRLVVQGCTNLANSDWVPLATNTLNGILTYFSDPAWTAYPTRFYRVLAP